MTKHFQILELSQKMFPLQLNPYGYLTNEEASSLLWEPIVCLSNHWADGEAKGRVLVNDTGKVVQITENRSGSDQWLAMVKWDKKSTAENLSETTSLPLTHNYGRDFYYYCKLISKPR